MDKITKEVLQLFEKINSIPRCSGHEEKMANWLKEWAVANGLSVKFDAVNNILITVPGSPGCKKLPAVAIQGHMDMVCDKIPASDHDFSRDPINHIVEGDWLKADGTSLGADNGIAIAIGLRLALDPGIKHPPLELLFTVDEESGLTGVNGITGDFISANTLLNLDSEHEGVFTIGCAGGLGTTIYLPLAHVELSDDSLVCRLTVDGLLGGHSGIDIHENRANANKILARTLSALITEFDINILDMNGGSAHNAIPRHAEALISLPFDRYEDALFIVRKTKDSLAWDLELQEPALSMDLSLKEGLAMVQMLSTDMSEKIIELLMEMPHGVIGMSQDAAGIVETSSNLATMDIEDDKLRIVVSLRSSVTSELDELSSSVRSIAESAGAAIIFDGSYPSWQPDISSELLKRCRNIYADLFSEEASIEIIHAGLECAVLGSKFPDMDMISLGPTIENPHSPDERLYIPSVIKVWDFLIDLLRSFCDDRNTPAKKSSGKVARKSNSKDKRKSKKKGSGKR